MTSRMDVQPLDRNGVLFAGLSVAFAVLYQVIWYVAPGLMATPVIGVTPLSVPFGVVSVFVPLLLAWLCARNDTASSETYETAKH